MTSYSVYGINGEWYIKDNTLDCLCSVGFAGLVYHPYKSRKQAQKIADRLNSNER